MITAAECKARMFACAKLAGDPNITMRRATAIMGVCRTWSQMEHRVEEYEAVLRQEGNEIQHATGSSPANETLVGVGG